MEVENSLKDSKSFYRIKLYASCFVIIVRKPCDMVKILYYTAHS